MANIVTVSCIIVAVYISFQKAEAGGLFDNPLGSLLNNAREDLPNKFQDVKEKGSEIRKGLKEDATNLRNNMDDFSFDSIKNSIGSILKNDRSIGTLECTKVYDDGRESLTQLASIFSSCVMSKSKSAREDVKKLIDLVSNLQEKMTKIAKDLIHCFQNSSVKIPKCLATVSRNIEALYPMIEEAKKTMRDLITTFPTMKGCLQKELTKFAQENSSKLVKDAGQCLQSILHKYINI